MSNIAGSMDDFDLSEISLVDAGAQKPAKAVIAKREDGGQAAVEARQSAFAKAAAADPMALRGASAIAKFGRELPPLRQDVPGAGHYVAKGELTSQRPNAVEQFDTESEPDEASIGDLCDADGNVDWGLAKAKAGQLLDKAARARAARSGTSYAKEYADACLRHPEAARLAM